MLRNNEGFFLLELLLSLSAMFMLCIYFIPLLMDLRAQSSALELEKTARQIMYEEMQAKLNDSKGFGDKNFIQNNILYQIQWSDSEEGGLKEVCVSVTKNTSHSQIEICGKLE
ncbi:hypothetical protein [Neobacillus kokaensis]|uniref:Competence protein ComG n=1 Tax=Neobacillus kokaensis TaxID=2759023 RepID=A0ABQ3MXM0_9BACI|nr:hypothetical protein [Neobacillus kokaensis]GHH96984.1 hypothetical protein AM1BK_05270 [Neobacillus kokaensis]